PTGPGPAVDIVPIAEGAVLAMKGRIIPAEERHVLRAFVTQFATAMAARRLTRQAEIAAQLGQADELRNALLAAVSHDLRTPLASIKASASSLLATDVEWSPEAIEA